MNTLELLVIKILVFLKNKKKQFKLKKNLNNSSLRYFNHNNFVIKILVFLIKQFKHHIIIKLVRVYR